MFSTYGVDEWHQPTAADSESQGFKPISHIDMGILHNRKLTAKNVTLQKKGTK
jgi:hypothetical protein